MNHLKYFFLFLFIATVSTSYAFSPFDSDTEVQAPIREGEKPVIPLDTKDPTYNASRDRLTFRNTIGACLGLAYRPSSTCLSH
jgi:hypothetical protein